MSNPLDVKSLFPEFFACETFPISDILNFFFSKIHYFFQVKLLVPQAKNSGIKLFTSRGLLIKVVSNLEMIFIV
jgi:hypothetical protein